MSPQSGLVPAPPVRRNRYERVLGAAALPPYVMARFWRGVALPQQPSGLSACWTWQGRYNTRNSRKYPRFRYYGHNVSPRKFMAKLCGVRLALTRRGCDNPLCVRPAHMNSWQWRRRLPRGLEWQELFVAHIEPQVLATRPPADATRRLVKLDGSVRDVQL